MVPQDASHRTRAKILFYKQTNELEKEQEQRMGIEILNELVKEKVRREPSGDARRHRDCLSARSHHIGIDLLGPVLCLPLKCLLLVQWEGLPALGMGCGPAGGGGMA